ncbi:MAG TPA: metallophosphoesterase [Bryobacteraceae bacterium]|nr:metallophosphoesterase [Bryobacteraceae bacterium]
MLIVLALLAASQIYWSLRAYRFIARRVAEHRKRHIVYAIVFAVYYATLLYNFDRIFQFPRFGSQPNPTHLGFEDAYLAVAQWWILSSLAAFLIALPIDILRALGRAALRRKPTASEGLQRRDFLAYGANAVVGFPFVAGAYGVLYGRLNLEITHRQIRLARLPKQFSGFRIAQLSDIHISSFMSEEQIRKYAAIANGLRADLLVLTGDFVTWDPGARFAVVNALTGLRAPFGVYACLGNHEAWAHVKEFITPLLEQAGIRVLRDRRVPIVNAGAELNLIGVEPDYGWSSHQVPEGLTLPDRVNILLSHYPTLFDHAAELGIDLTLSGHTHGGQIKLNYISPRIPPAILRTPYVQGWFQKPGGQLYVNRGIGTIGIPMRVGVSPEMTVFELVTG